MAATSGADAAGAAAWKAMRATSDIQFAPIDDPPPTPPPAWLVAIGHVLNQVFGWIARAIDWLFGWIASPIARLLGANARTIEYVLIGLAAAVLAWGVWAWLMPLWRARRAVPPAPARSPDATAALALLDDADALAAQGRYAEATRLLLQCSVGEIAATTPEWLAPSSTAREIAAHPRLPWAARQAFAVIAREVERSLFALTGLVCEDWERARAAYAQFALADLGASPGAGPEGAAG